jgi:23S rRNA pseudouridine1911/1915/1917 synthase
MPKLLEHKVPDDIAHQRIYDYCTGLFAQLPSRKSVKKALDKGEILLNGDKTETGYWLKGGEHIELVDLELTPPKTYEFELEVVFEDNHLAVIIKPAGLLTSGNAFKTVTNALSHNINPSTAVDALNWPKPTHRLDKQTSGLLIIAKTKTARMKIGQQFEQNEIDKTYQALVLGKLEGEGIIENPIDGKDALTQYKSLKIVESLRSEHISLVRLFPKTGRTHQLRKHLSGIGHAILGDPLYSPPKLFLKHKGLFLCATDISFKHPITKEYISFRNELPKKFIRRLKSEKNMFIRSI